jgi:phytoene dehydrogenase-like protein
MQNKIDNKYDVVIIGAGIAGLICGTVLSKNDLRVLIVEKNKHVGGYCSSFVRNNFKFDIGVHYLGSLRRNGGQLSRILDEIELSNDLEFINANPSDILLFKDFEISFGKNIEGVIHSFRKVFPAELYGIKRFIDYMCNTDFYQLYKQNIKLTFRDLLDKYFKSEHLKQVFSVLLGNVGLPSDKVAAVTAIILYREYIFDGGYYPKGGIQNFADKICQKFKKFGGEILLNSEVKQILLNGKDNKARSVIINDKEINAHYIVSCTDSFHTFFSLLSGVKELNLIRNKIKKLIPSFSAFVIYLGVKNSTQGLDKIKCSTWICPDGNIDSYYDSIINNNLDFDKNFLLISRPTFFDKSIAPKGNEIVSVFTAAPFKDIDFWMKNKKIMYESILSKTKRLIPGLTAQNIIIKESASPATFYKFTYNYRGALYGWAPTPEQISSNLMPPKLKGIRNVLFAGHWTTQGYAQGGIPVVAISGKNVARLILDNFSKGYL